MKLIIFYLLLSIVILFSIANAQSFAPVNVRIDAAPEYAPGMLRANVPFTVDLYLENVGPMPLPSIISSMRFYSPDGITTVTPVTPDSGTVYLGNIALMNGFGWMGYWDLINVVGGASWDASLPDTFYHVGATMFGGWPTGLGEQLHYGFSFEISDEGTFCIEWVDPTTIDTNFAIEFENMLNLEPKCWSINDIGICGDFNGDGIVNVFDIVYVIQCLYFPLWPPCEFDPWIFDVNNDAVINIFDIIYLISYLYLDGPELLCPPPPEP